MFSRRSAARSGVKKRDVDMVLSSEAMEEGLAIVVRTSERSIQRGGEKTGEEARSASGRGAELRPRSQR